MRTSFTRCATVAAPRASWWQVLGTVKPPGVGYAALSGRPPPAAPARRA
ncbi:hypothetical protein [Ornithinimicrobium humiphilum]|nr:hypothetical protein [Ornithinimicrobium humiphilum]